MSNKLGHVATLLCAAGFEPSYQLSQEEFDRPINPMCEIEEYLGWNIQSEPTFAVIHLRTGFTWVTWFEELEDVERVKFLIRKGIEVDLEIAMGVQP